MHCACFYLCKAFVNNETYHFMERICPIWILTSLTGDAFEKFKLSVNRQFKAFSETELEGFENCETHQWWGVETTAGGLNGKWNDTTGYPINITAFLPLNQQGIVIFYAPLSDFTRASVDVAELKKNPKFFQTYGGNRFFYGLTSFRKKETADAGFLDLMRAIEEDEKKDRLYSSITFLSDSSHNASENPKGYQTLSEEDYLSLVVNTIFTIAITKRTIDQLYVGQNRLFNTAGVFSFTYEPEAFKKSKAYHMAEQLLDAFCNDEKDAEWCSENDAKAHFDGASLKRNLHWYTIYKLLSSGFEEETMKGLYSQCKISPWRMFAYKLVPLYFRKYVKSILWRTYNNVHDFASLTQMRYESFARKKRQQMLDGSTEIEDRQLFAKTAIASYLSSIWDPSYKGAKGIRQVALLLDRTKRYLVEQKNEVGRVKDFGDSKDDEHKDFPQLEDYPLKEIFKKESVAFRKHYEELVTNGEPPAERTEEADKSYEERLLSRLHNILKWHAMPLNLFTKAGLLSVLVFVTIWSGIAILQSTNKVHLFSLDTDLSLISLFIASAVIVLVFAFVKYGLKTLRRIRLMIQKYIAWSYYKVQRELYVFSLVEEEKYYDALIDECDRINELLNSVVKLEVLNKPSFEKYKESKFQRNILDKMDDGSDILDKTALNVTLKLNDSEFPLDKVARGLFEAMLREGDQKLDEKMRVCLLDGNENASVDNIKEELLKLWSDILAAHIQILIYGEYGKTIDFPAFHNSKVSNFSNETWSSASAIFYPSVYVYAIRPYSWGISIVPNGQGYEDGSRWESLFFEPTQSFVNQRLPDFVKTKNPQGWLSTKQISIFMRVHSYDRIIVKGKEDTETTIFNNQLI